MSRTIEQILLAAIEKVNPDLPEHMRLGSAKSQVLMGEGGAIDSMGVVMVLAAIEEEILKAFDIELILGEDLEESSEINPFLTLGSLGEYIFKTVRGQGIKVEPE